MPPRIAPPPPYPSRLLGDLDVLALTLYHEAALEGERGMVAVGCVIRNRLAWGRWGDTMRAVCLAPKQFSCWRSVGGPENFLSLTRHADEIRAGNRPTVMRLAYLVAARIMGTEPDITQGADHYYAPAAMKPPGKVPSWAVPSKRVAVIGRHIFYRIREGDEA